ncbi:MAG: Co2+/Mg2+ efflux protein ApaG [Ignavibacteria bacterium]|nr:Co2+/Mg2+ efflux protein ApaG [Ignavibacteria bacterium]
MTNPNSDTTTLGIRVEVSPEFIPERSEPDKKLFFFIYNIRITNNSEDNLQLLSRYWLIINADGDENEVKGEGVVGQFPYLKPGQYFEYSSFTPLDTDWGTMEGYYCFEKDNGEKVEAKIGRFYLTSDILV